MKVVGLLTCLVAAPLFAESLVLDSNSSFSFSGNNHTLFTNTDGLSERGTSPQLLRSETQLRGEADELSASVLFSNRFATSKPDGKNVPFYLEKKSIVFENERWRIAAGDSHYELGQGIALALFRDDLLGINNTLEGVLVRYSPEAWEVTALGGRVRTLKSPVALMPFQVDMAGREIWLSSLAVKRKWSETQIGAHYLFTTSHEALSSDKSWHTAGGTLKFDNFAPGWDAYAESNMMIGDNLSLGTPLATGFGTYASVVYSPLPWKLKLEARDYRDYNYDFHRPPTMEEDIVTSLNFQNVTAAKFTAERRMGVYNSIRASLMSGEDRLLHTTLHHAVVAGKWKMGEVAFESRLGHRWMIRQAKLAHGDIKAKIPTLSGQFVEVGYRKLFNNTGLNGIPNLDDRNFFDLAYTFSPKWSLNVGVEYVPSNVPADGQTFVNAGTLVKFDSFQSRAFVGSTSGGPQCSGGICRLVPAYSGVALEGTYTF